MESACIPSLKKTDKRTLFQITSFLYLAIKYCKKTGILPFKTESTVRIAVSLAIRTSRIIIVGACKHLSYVHSIDILDDILSKQDSSEQDCSEFELKLELNHQFILGCIDFDFTNFESIFTKTVLDIR